MEKSEVSLDVSISARDCTMVGWWSATSLFPLPLPLGVVLCNREQVSVYQKFSLKLCHTVIGIMYGSLQHCLLLPGARFPSGCWFLSPSPSSSSSPSPSSPFQSVHREVSQRTISSLSLSTAATVFPLARRQEVRKNVQRLLVARVQQQHYLHSNKFNYIWFW